MTFRLHQRVMRISWRNGIPFLRIRTVTKITKRTLYLDNNDRPTQVSWCSSLSEAIEAEYKSIFNDWATFIPNKKVEGWTVEDSIECICRVRRLERRLTKK